MTNLMNCCVRVLNYCHAGLDPASSFVFEDWILAFAGYDNTPRAAGHIPLPAGQDPPELYSLDTSDEEFFGAGRSFLVDLV